MQRAFRPVIIESVYPELDCGSYPVKREVGDRFEVWADLFKEGHDRLDAVLKYREKGSSGWSETPMSPYDNDRWTGSFTLANNARYEYTIEAWTDELGTWRTEVGKKVDAGQNVELELIEGRSLVEDALERSHDKRLRETLSGFDAAGYEGRVALLRSEEVRELMGEYPDRSTSTVYGNTLEIVVDRERARFGAWYEMFPRSQGTVPGRSATFAEAERRLPEISDLGFDVVYLTPIHPIGTSHRKGRTTPSPPAQPTPAARTPSGARTAGTRPSTPTSGRLRTSGTSWMPAASTGWRSRSTSPSSVRRIIRTSKCTPNGSNSGPMGASSTPRTHPRSIRTSSTWTSIQKIGRTCGGSGST